MFPLRWALAALAAACTSLSAAFASPHNAYVYVSDAYNHTVNVYPVGVANASPLNVVPVNGTPTAMATAKNGDLYVVVSGSVIVYSPGARSILGSIGASQGIMSARGVAFDTYGNLYVTCERMSDSAPGVMKFNGSQAVGWYASPTNQIYGLTLNAGNLFVDTGFNGKLLEYPRASLSGYKIAGIGGAPSAGGLAFSGNDIVMTGGTGMFVFTPAVQGAYPYQMGHYFDFGVGHATGYPVFAGNSLYVPVNGGSGDNSQIHEVRVFPATQQFSIWSTISAGLQEPVGVAVGPK